MLSDGRVYHQQCYDKVLQCIEQLDKQMDNNQQEIWRLSRRVEEEQSFFVRLRRLFSDSESEVPNSRKRIAELEQETHRLSQERARHLLTLEHLHDYWLTSRNPPDWDLRRKQVLERFPDCQGEGPHSGPLHVHHKIPISKGGNHRLENLIVLCEHCHGNLAISFSKGEMPNVFAILEIPSTGLLLKKTRTFTIWRIQVIPANPRHYWLLEMCSLNTKRSGIT